MARMASSISCDRLDHTAWTFYPLCILCGPLQVGKMGNGAYGAWPGARIMCLILETVRSKSAHSDIKARVSSVPSSLFLLPPPPIPSPLTLQFLPSTLHLQNSGIDFRKYWMPDKACKECSECNVKFGIFVRRHHCRICGRIFCHTCCNITIPGALLRPDLQVGVSS